MQRISNNTLRKIHKLEKEDGTCSYLLKSTPQENNLNKLEKAKSHSITKNKNQKINPPNKISPNLKSEPTVFDIKCESNQQKDYQIKVN